MDETILLDLGRSLRSRGWRLATAESCTGGLIGHLATSVSGSSDWFLGGVIAYSPEVKTLLLDVPARIIDTHGVVSRETVRAMAAGARARLGAEIAVAVSGVAGPTGGTPGTPVGTVWLGWSWPEGERQTRQHFPGDRAEVKRRAAEAGLLGVLHLAGGGT